MRVWKTGGGGTKSDRDGNRDETKLSGGFKLFFLMEGMHIIHASGRAGHVEITEQK